ncbi:hypothetical protein NP493_2956g00012 [Ridgeia piscesae]|uniref:Uncharacterized protein n=1 Tax=Ridgeia piscesae TaxID=27915 RepID=A0AAD9JBU7_RIDPI|nr:hypothetical protein NP493_2956g00012 [Ridgeia piscesae]
MLHQWTIAAETATSAEFGGACNYAAAEPRPPPHPQCCGGGAVHRLPVPWRITYKILVLNFEAMHDLAPKCIADMKTEYTPGRQLRSAGSRLLRVPRHNLECYGRRRFSVTAPRLWNDLPDSLRLIDSH